MKKNHENTVDNPTIKKGRFVPTINIQRDLYNYANYNEIPLDKKFERSFQLTYRDPSRHRRPRGKSTPIHEE